MVIVVILIVIVILAIVIVVIVRVMDLTSNPEKTPSGLDGIEPGLETAYRFRTAWFIEELGKALSW